MYKNRKSETKQNEFYLTFWVKFQFFFLSARNIEINIGPQRWGNIGAWLGCLFVTYARRLLKKMINVLVRP